MPDPDKQAQMDELLRQPVLARIATANPANCQPHVTPVWFWWDGQAVWISAFDSTRKIRNLRRNARISVLIEPSDPSDSQLQAVLFEGQAVLIKDPRIVREMSARIYTHYMGEEGVKAEDPQAWIVDPENTIIRLAPEKTFTW